MSVSFRSSVLKLTTESVYSLTLDGFRKAWNHIVKGTFFFVLVTMDGLLKEAPGKKYKIITRYKMTTRRLRTTAKRNPTTTKRWQITITHNTTTKRYKMTVKRCRATMRCKTYRLKKLQRDIKWLKKHNNHDYKDKQNYHKMNMNNKEAQKLQDAKQLKRNA